MHCELLKTPQQNIPQLLLEQARADARGGHARGRLTGISDQAPVSQRVPRVKSCCLCVGQTFVFLW